MSRPHRHRLRSAHQAAIARIVPEQRPELASATVQAGHHRADRGAHDLGDLLVREALDIGQIDREPELLRNLLQRRLDIAVGQMLERLGFSRLESGGRMGLGPRELPVLDLVVRVLDRLALLLR